VTLDTAARHTPTAQHPPTGAPTRRVWRAAHRRRRIPLLSVGGLLVVVCVLGYSYGALRLGDRQQVLVVTRPVPAGQPLTGADLTAVAAARDRQVPLIPATQTGRVIGQVAVVPLLPGTLLTPALLGQAAFPPPGKMAASLALKPGQYPHGLTGGARVAVFLPSTPTGPAAPAGTTTASPAPAAGVAVGGAAGSTVAPRLDAVVLALDPTGDGQPGAVVTVLLDADDGAQLAAAPTGSVVLMQTAAKRS
jgi:hypothetical protein